MEEAKPATMKKEWKTFSGKDRIVNIIGFASYRSLLRLLNSEVMVKSSQRQYRNECMLLCSNKTLFVDTI